MNDAVLAERGRTVAVADPQRVRAARAAHPDAALRDGRAPHPDLRPRPGAGA